MPILIQAIQGDDGSEFPMGFEDVGQVLEIAVDFPQSPCLNATAGSSVSARLHIMSSERYDDRELPIAALPK